MGQGKVYKTDPTPKLQGFDIVLVDLSKELKKGLIISLLSETERTNRIRSKESFILESVTQLF